jgi:hypothetical protein
MDEAGEIDEEIGKLHYFNICCKARLRHENEKVKTKKLQQLATPSPHLLLNI